MARINRREVLAEDEVQIVHCINRCVRRGFCVVMILSRAKTSIIDGSGIEIDWNP